jgi:hypothetical protein
MNVMPNILQVEEKKLLEKLREAEAAVSDGKGWLSLEELKNSIEEV